MFGPLLVGTKRGTGFRKVIADIRQLRIQTRTNLHPRTRGLRRRLVLSVCSELSQTSPGIDRDLLDEIVTSCPGAEPDQIADLYLSFLFAILGSLSFSLTWAVHLLAQHPTTDATARSIVLEALRLYPIAWLIARTPNSPFCLRDESVAITDTVVVSPYVIHRRADCWEAPNSFVPERWEDSARRSSWLPFGCGAHACIAASFTVEMLAALIQAIRLRGRPMLRRQLAKPVPSPALRPPKFELTLA